MPTKIREILTQLRHDGWVEVARKAATASSRTRTSRAE